MGETKQETHVLRPAGANWGVDTNDRNVEEVVTFIKGFNREQIMQAAHSYKKAHEAVNTAKEALKTEARELAQVWEGQASVEAQEALGVLYVTLGELATKLDKMHQTVSALDTVVRKHQEFIEDDIKGVLPTWQNQGIGGIGSFTDDIPDLMSAYTGVYGGDSAKTDWGRPNELAGLHLKTFGEDLQHLHGMMPERLEKALRDIQPPTRPVEDPRPVVYPTDDGRDPRGVTPLSYNDPRLNGGPSGVPTTDDPSLRPTTPGTPTTPGVPDPNVLDPDLPGDPSPDLPTTPDPTNPGDQTPTTPDPGAGTPTTPTTPTTNLQDYQPPPNGYSPTSGTHYPTINPPPSITTTTPGTSGGPGSYGGGGLVPGAGAGAGLTPGARGASGTGMGMPFLPMGAMGGAGAEEGRDREATTWLQEDDDVWGGDADSVVNSRIG
jgi:uncharacterized protein YukE